MNQVIAAQSGIAFILKKGQLLKVIDPTGKQVSDLFCVSEVDKEEWLSSSRSMDYADSLFLGEGQSLYSNRSNPMLKIVEDSCRCHDFLMPPCSLRMFQIVSNNQEFHPSCDENLVKGLQEFGVPPDRVSTAFNIFMNVRVGEDGRMSISPPRSKPGDSITFEAEMDLVIGLTACSHEETNGGVCKPIHFEILNAVTERKSRHSVQPRMAEMEQA